MPNVNHSFMPRKSTHKFLGFCNIHSDTTIKMKDACCQNKISTISKYRHKTWRDEKVVVQYPRKSKGKDEMSILKVNCYLEGR